MWIWIWTPTDGHKSSEFGFGRIFGHLGPLNCLICAPPCYSGAESNTSYCLKELALRPDSFIEMSVHILMFSPSHAIFFEASHWPTLGGQNWVHQHNNMCVGALHLDPWCTLNLLLSHDHFSGLSLVTAPGVKIGYINTTIFVLEHSILTLGALLTYSLANTSNIITFQASHCISAKIRISREILSPVCEIFYVYYMI